MPARLRRGADDPDTIINADARRRALKARADMIARIWKQKPGDADELPPIAGEENVAAG